MNRYVLMYMNVQVCISKHQITSYTHSPTHPRAHTRTHMLEYERWIESIENENGCVCVCVCV